MSIQNFEIPDLVQGEFWKWERDDQNVALPCMEVPIPFVERLWTQLDLLADRREAAKAIVTIDEKLTPTDTSHRLRRRRVKPLITSGLIQPFPQHFIHWEE